MLIIIITYIWTIDLFVPIMQVKSNHCANKTSNQGAIITELAPITKTTKRGRAFFWSSISLSLSSWDAELGMLQWRQQDMSLLVMCLTAKISCSSKETNKRKQKRERERERERERSHGLLTKQHIFLCSFSLIRSLEPNEYIPWTPEDKGFGSLGRDLREKIQGAGGQLNTFFNADPTNLGQCGCRDKWLEYNHAHQKLYLSNPMGIT